MGTGMPDPRDGLLGKAKSAIEDRSSQLDAAEEAAVKGTAPEIKTAPKKAGAPAPQQKPGLIDRLKKMIGG